ncbi:BAR/IMD domain-containing adapter protein 2-like isoform X2 [Porites lutea]|uniref:BAR/IMD domain-containing adapter protein 2-like isoform X2 n=1 Tax=Porites lutea TaxID=51062 RepID=UPI003CC53835
MDVLKDLETKTGQELHNITLATYQNIIDLCPVLKELAVNAKNYLKSLHNVRQAASAFHDSLAKISEKALSSEGTAHSLGDPIRDLVSVRKDMEARHVNVMKYLQNDLITPLERLAESDVLYVKSFQKNYGQENKTKVESVDKAKGELLKVRKKSQRKKPTEKYEDKEKQCEEQVASCQKELHEFRLTSCRKAMAEEKKRYCLVLDRTSIVAKSTMEFCEHNSQILREKVPMWFSHVKRKGDSADFQINGSVMNAEMENLGRSNKVELRAKFIHTAVEPSQLSFKEGDLIHPISEVVSGWQYGENLKTSKSGWFPAAYTEQVIAVSTGPTVSHTLPAGGVHPRPPLETSISHKSLKRYSSTGPDTLHLPPPDYADVDSKAENEQTSSSDTPEISDNQPSTLTVTISPTALNGNKTSPVPPPPPPPPPPTVTLPEENDDREKRMDPNDAVTNSSSDVSHF